MNTQNETRTEWVKRKLQAATPKKWPEIALLSGVPFKTMQKIAHGTTKDPRASTIDPLFTYLKSPKRKTHVTPNQPAIPNE